MACTRLIKHPTTETCPWSASRRCLHGLLMVLEPPKLLLLTTAMAAAHRCPTSMEAKTHISSIRLLMATLIPSAIIIITPPRMASCFRMNMVIHDHRQPCTVHHTTQAYYLLHHLPATPPPIYPRRNILRYALRTRTIRCSFVKYCLPLTILLSISVYCSRLSSLSIIRYFWTAPSVHLCGWFACYSPQFILAIFCSIALFSEFLCSRCSLSLSLRNDLSHCFDCYLVLLAVVSSLRCLFLYLSHSPLLFTPHHLPPVSIFILGFRPRNTQWMIASSPDRLL